MTDYLVTVVDEEGERGREVVAANSALAAVTFVVDKHEKRGVTIIGVQVETVEYPVFW